MTVTWHILETIISILFQLRCCHFKSNLSKDLLAFRQKQECLKATSILLLSLVSQPGELLLRMNHTFFFFFFLQCAGGLICKNGSLVTNEMQLLRQRMKYLEFKLSAIKIKVKVNLKDTHYALFSNVVTISLHFHGMSEVFLFRTECHRNTKQQKKPSF